MNDTTRKASLLVVFLTVFIDLLGFGMVLPLLPIYAKHFAADLGLAEDHATVGLLIGLVMSSFSGMQFIFSPIWGRISDRVGRRPILMLGLAGSVVFYAMFGIATVYKSLALLFVSRIGAGIAGATIATAQAYIADSTTLEHRARGMALIGAAFGLGFTFGPLFGALALPGEGREPGPGPGYAAAALSAVALALAYFKLPESLQPGARAPARSWFHLAALRDALSVPSIGLLLVAIFVCIFSFANFESTLSLILNDRDVGFNFKISQVSWTFAYIGIVLTLVQGLVVRRVSMHVREPVLATAGALIEMCGFGLMIAATRLTSVPLLLGGLALVVGGFACVTPSLNALLSRWSDPARQGGILGVGQSINSLARILGPLVGVPLLENDALASQLRLPSASLPLALALVLMAAGLLLVVVASRRGRDYGTPTV